jgi:hypothetical protein
MSEPWVVKDLEEHVRALGDARRGMLDVLHSVGRYIDIYRYHLYQAREAVARFVAVDDPHGIKKAKYVLGLAEDQESFLAAKIASEAHILGCIHSARSLFDVFAFLLNGLLLDDRLSADKCNIHSVTKELPACALRSRLESLLNSYWFCYVAAFGNTAKHRRLVPHAFWMSFESGKATIRLDGFEYKGKAFALCSEDELLRGTLEVKNAIVDCGRLLNAHLMPGSA